MSFNVLKELQWAAYVGPAADVREDHHLGAGLRGETGLICISKQGKCLGELHDLFKRYLPCLEKGNIAGISLY